MIKLKSAKVVAEGKSVADWLEKQLAEKTEHADMVTYSEDGPQASKDIFNTIVTDAAPSKDEALAAAKDRGLDVGTEPEKRIFTMIASDERVDRHGDIVKQNWLLDDFQKNPVILPNHNWSSLPIGNSLIEKVISRKTEEFNGKALQLTTLQHDLTEEAASFTRLMQAKFLRTGSVGFYPGRVIDIEDEKERDKLGLGKYGLILDNNTLIEHSIVTLPANTGAQIISNAAKSGMLAAKDIQMIRECYRINVGTKAGGEAWSQTDYQMRELWKRLFPDVKVFKHEDPEQPIEFDNIDVGKALEESLEPPETPEVKSEFSLFPVKKVEETPPDVPEVKEPVDTDDENALDATELLNEATLLMSEMKDEMSLLREDVKHLAEVKTQPKDGQSEGEDLGAALCNSLTDKPE